MTAYLMRRLAYGVLILLGVNLLTFVLFFALNTPDDMARLSLGGKRVTPDQIEKWKAQHGYDKPMLWDPSKEGTAQLTQTVFWDRCASLFALEFGRSDTDSAGLIGPQIAQKAKISLRLTLPVFLLGLWASVLLAFGLVIFRHTRLERWSLMVTVVLMSISSLFYIIVGQYVFSKWAKLAPISGYQEGLSSWRYLLLPIALSVLSRLGAEVRFFRGLFLEEIGKDYVRTAKAKGLGAGRVMWAHVMRNAALPLITTVGSALPYLFMGSLLLESFFGIPGLGSYTVDAIAAQDFAVVRTMVFLGSLFYVLSNVLIDLAYAWADPRVRIH